MKQLWCARVENRKSCARISEQGTPLNSLVCLSQSRNAQTSPKSTCGFYLQILSKLLIHFNLVWLFREEKQANVSRSNGVLILLTNQSQCVRPNYTFLVYRSTKELFFDPFLSEILVMWSYLTHTSTGCEQTSTFGVLDDSVLNKDRTRGPGYDGEPGKVWDDSLVWEPHWPAEDQTGWSGPFLWRWWESPLKSSQLLDQPRRFWVTRHVFHFCPIKLF